MDTCIEHIYSGMGWWCGFAACSASLIVFQLYWADGNVIEADNKMLMLCPVDPVFA